MELDIADIFAWLAFVEALSFEDFKLAMAVGLEDFALAMAIGTTRMCAVRNRGLGEALVISADGNSRLLLLPGPQFACPADVREEDIVCVCPAAQSPNGARGEQLFRDLAERGVRTCLMHRSERPYCPPETAAAVKVHRWIEWPTPNSNGMSLSGLVFSDRWTADAPGHAAKTVASFMTTLAPPIPNAGNPAYQQH
jgi:hypothetical protein